MRKIEKLGVEALEDRLNLSAVTTLMAPALMMGSTIGATSHVMKARPTSLHAILARGEMVAGQQSHGNMVAKAKAVRGTAASTFSTIPVANHLTGDAKAAEASVVLPSVTTSAPVIPVVAATTVIATQTVTPDMTGIQTTGPIQALTWSANPGGVTNLTAMNRVAGWMNPADVAQASLSDPPGMANLFLWDMTNDLLTNPADVAKTPAGKATPYESPWFDAGTATVKARAEAFFSAFKAAGGRLDFLVLDYEEGLSNWQLSDAQAQAIQNDPRSAALLQSIGVTSMANVMNTKTGEYLKWNNAMNDRLNQALDTAIFNVAKKYFPNMKGSNFNGQVMTGNNIIPEVNGHMQWSTTHAGTTNSSALYGVAEQVSLKQLVPGTPYGNSPLAVLRWEVNTVRGVNLSNTDGMVPWIQYQSYGDSAFKNNGYYQEMIYQAALSGSSEFLLWNPTPWAAGQNAADFSTDAQTRVVDQTLTELNAQLGPGTRTVVTPKTMAWDSGLVVSGVEVGTSKVVWRVSVPEGTTQVKIAETGEVLNVEGEGVWYQSTPGTSVTFQAMK